MWQVLEVLSKHRDPDKCGWGHQVTQSPLPKELCIKCPFMPCSVHSGNHRAGIAG